MSTYSCKDPKAQNIYIFKITTRPTDIAGQLDCVSVYSARNKNGRQFPISISRTTGHITSLSFITWLEMLTDSVSALPLSESLIVMKNLNISDISHKNNLPSSIWTGAYCSLVVHSLTETMCVTWCNMT